MSQDNDDFVIANMKPLIAQKYETFEYISIFASYKNSKSVDLIFCKLKKHVCIFAN